MRNKYLRKLIQYKDIVIFGAGNIGKQCLETLKDFDCVGKVSCFVTSERSEETTTIGGIPVRSVYDVPEKYKSALFILAVGAGYLPEVKSTVKKLRVSHWMDERALYMQNGFENPFLKLFQSVRNHIYLQREAGKYGKEQHAIKATHITYCIANNAGDTVLSQCVRRFLKFERWNMVAVNAPVTDASINEVNACDTIVIGGGGLFLPDTNKNAISGWQWAISEEQLNQIQVPLIVYSVGYNYFKGQTPSELFERSLCKLIEKADFVGLRNMGSVESVRRIVPDELKDKITYQPCTTTLIRKMYPVKKTKHSKIIGINIAFDREERRYGNDRNEILIQIAKAAKEIERKGYTIWYIAHCDTDLRFLHFLDLQGVNYQVKNLTHSLPSEVIKCYSKVELVAGMRGHAQMIPFGIGCRIITLGSHDKMKWFLDDIHALDWYVDIRDNVEKLSENIKTVFEHVNELCAQETDLRLEKEQQRLWEISRDNRDKIIKLIEERQRKK